MVGGIGARIDLAMATGSNQIQGSKTPSKCETSGSTTVCESAMEDQAWKLVEVISDQVD